MPEMTVVTPAAVVPADRLTLGATDARCPGTPLQVYSTVGVGACSATCLMAEE